MTSWQEPILLYEQGHCILRASQRALVMGRLGFVLPQPDLYGCMLTQSDGSAAVTGVLEDLLPSLCPKPGSLGSSAQRGRSVGPTRPTAGHSEQPGEHRGSSDADGSEAAEEQQGNAVERMHSKLLFHGKQLEVLVAGVPVSLDAPILWLHATLHHPDFFLYIVVHLQHA